MTTRYDPDGPWLAPGDPEALDDPLVADLRAALAPVPPPDARRLRAHRSAFLTAGAALAPAPRSRWRRVRRVVLRYGSALVAMLLCFLIGGRAVSASSLPGDDLYLMKLGIEQVDALFLGSDTLEARRQAEVRQLAAQGESAPYVAFQGLLERAPGGDWRLGGVPLLLTRDQQRLVQHSCADRPVKAQGSVVDGIFRPTHLTPTCIQVTEFARLP